MGPTRPEQGLLAGLPLEADWRASAVDPSNPDRAEAGQSTRELTEPQVTRPGPRASQPCLPVRLLQMLLVIALVLAYACGAIRNAEKDNQRHTSADQGAYMAYTRAVWEEGFLTPRGDRARMPLYPWLQSLFYDPALSLEAHFARGKLVNIGLSVLLLAAIYGLLRQRLAWLPATALLTVIAFTVFFHNAHYFQPELLTYALNLASFLLMLRVLAHWNWRTAILAGMALGLSHLAKATAPPSVALFGLWGCIGASLALERAPGPAATGVALQRWRPFVRRLLPVALVIGVFLAVVTPYLMQSKAVFGRYWYNVSSTFYMWYDSWDEAEAGTRAHGDRLGWPDMPAEDIPSLPKYVREHSFEQIVGRVWSGLVHLEGACRRSYGYYKYAVFYGLALLAHLGLNKNRAVAYLRQRAIPSLFWVSYMVAWPLANAWYVPIADSPRFILAHFMPFVVTAAYVLHAPTLAPPPVILAGRRISPIMLFDLAILVASVSGAFVTVARVIA